MGFEEQPESNRKRKRTNPPPIKTNNKRRRDENESTPEHSPPNKKYKLDVSELCTLLQQLSLEYEDDDVAGLRGIFQAWNISENRSSEIESTPEQSPPNKKYKLDVSELCFLLQQLSLEYEDDDVAGLRGIFQAWNISEIPRRIKSRKELRSEWLTKKRQSHTIS